MKRLLLATVVAMGFVMPAFAMDDMTCADFMKQDSAMQMKTAESMKTDGAMASGGMMAGGDAATGMATACKAHPDMTLHDAMGAMGKM